MDINVDKDYFIKLENHVRALTKFKEDVSSGSSDNIIVIDKRNTNDYDTSHTPVVYGCESDFIEPLENEIERLVSINKDRNNELIKLNRMLSLLTDTDIVSKALSNELDKRGQSHEPSTEHGDWIDCTYSEVVDSMISIVIGLIKNK